MWQLHQNTKIDAPVLRLGIEVIAPKRWSSMAIATNAQDLGAGPAMASAQGLQPVIYGY
jgi:hypothetical protein